MQPGSFRAAPGDDPMNGSVIAGRVEQNVTFPHPVLLLAYLSATPYTYTGNLGGGMYPKLLDQQIRDGARRSVETLQEAVEELCGEDMTLSAACRAMEAARRCYAELLDAALDGYLMTDADGIILEANRAAAALLGVHRDALIGRPLTGYVSPEDRDLFSARLRRLRRGEEVPAWEVLLETRDEAPRCVAVSVASLREIPESPGILRWMLRDVTVQRRAEAELRIKDCALASSAQAILIADLSGAITYANPSCLDMWGYEHPADVLGRRIARLFREDDGIDRMKGVLNRDGVWTGDLIARRRDGSTFTVRFSANVVHDEAGNPLCIVGTGTDATEQRYAERERQRMENLYRTIFDATGNAMLIVDQNGTIAIANMECEHLFGYPRSALEGDVLWTRLFEGNDRVIIREYLRLSRDNPAYAPRRYTLRLKDGWGATRDVVVTAARIPGTACHVVSLRDITDQRRVEAALQESEEMYRGIAQRSFDIIFTCDRDWTISYASPAVNRVCGYLPEDVIGTSFRDWASPSSVGRLEEASRLIARGRDVEGLCIALKRRDGTPCIVEIDASPIIKDGRVVGIQGVGRDITDRVRAEAELKIKEKAIASSVNGIALVDLDGTIAFANRALIEGYGYGDAEEVLGMPVTSLYRNEDEAQRALDDVVESGAWAGEIVAKRKDGSVFDAQIFANMVTDDAGNPLCVVIYGMDITERKRIEEELRNRNRQLSALNQILGISTLSLSIDELLEMSVRKTLELLGFDIGIAYLLDPERKRAILQCHIGASRSYLSRNRVFRVHHWPFNLIFVAGQARYLVNGPKHSLTSLEAQMLRDLGASSLACVPLITESIVVGALYTGSRTEQGFSRESRIMLEAIGREIGSGILKGMLQKRLEGANREANLYLDIITHDIRNADNVSSLYCDLLIDTLEGDSLTYARKLRGSIRKSVEIIKNVSTIRRLHQETARIKPVDLDRLIREEIVHFPDAHIRYDGCTVLVEADDLLSEVFTNLIANAVKFGGPGVEIDIRVEEREGDVLVSVEDTGQGIPDEMKEAIFRRFERGQSRSTGEGLGLYITRTLVERYGGRVWAEDRVEGQQHLGAAFRFILRKAVHPGSESR